MSYRIDDGFDTWPETIRAGTAAAGLYCRCGSWISRNETDGFVPSEVAAMYGSPEWVRKLVDVGLWEATESGYRDTRYFPLNPTAEKARKQRRDAADRQARARARKDSHGEQTRESRVTHSVSHGAPFPSPPKGGRGTGGLRAAPPDPSTWQAQLAPGEMTAEDLDRKSSRVADIRAALDKKREAS